MKTSTLGDRRAPPKSFRDRLRDELARRCKANARYSLRAFARFLRVDAATLSQLLRGKRRVTDAAIRRLGARLGIDPANLDELVALERARPEVHPAAEIDVGAVRELTADTLDALASWHDWAILELTRTESFVPDLRWIARVLDCSVDDVQLAVHRLVRSGFLQMASRTKWVDTTAPFARTPDEFAHAAVERLADQLHRLSLRVAQARAPSGWLHDATTLALSTTSVPGAIVRLEQLRAEVVASLEREPRKDAVYYLAVSFIPIATTEQSSMTNEGGM